MTCAECRHLMAARNVSYNPNCIRYPRWVAHQPGDPACGEFGEKSDGQRIADGKPGDVVAVADVNKATAEAAEIERQRKPKRKGKGQ